MIGVRRVRSRLGGNGSRLRIQVQAIKKTANILPRCWQRCFRSPARFWFLICFLAFDAPSKAFLLLAPRRSCGVHVQPYYPDISYLEPLLTSWQRKPPPIAREPICAVRNPTARLYEADQLSGRFQGPRADHEVAAARPGAEGAPLSSIHQRCGARAAHLRSLPSAATPRCWKIRIYRPSCTRSSARSSSRRKRAPEPSYPRLADAAAHRRQRHAHGAIAREPARAGLPACLDASGAHSARPPCEHRDRRRGAPTCWATP